MTIDELAVAISSGAGGDGARDRICPRPPTCGLMVVHDLAMCDETAPQRVGRLLCHGGSRGG